MDDFFLYVPARSKWLMGGGLCVLPNTDTAMRVIRTSDWLFDAEAMRRTLKLEQLTAVDEFRLLRQPARPAWSFTPFAAILRELGVSEDSLTRLGRPPEISSPKKPLVILQRSVGREGIPYNNRVTGVDWIVTQTQVVGQVVKMAPNVWEVNFNHTMVASATNLSLMRPSSERPDFSGVKATIVAGQKESLAIDIRDFSRSIAILEEQTTTLLRQKTAAESTLELINSDRFTPRLDVDDPRVAGAWVVPDGERVGEIYVLTHPLTCTAEFKDGIRRTFLLGPLTVQIAWYSWAAVMVTTTEVRAIAHPHTNTTHLCLGHEFGIAAGQFQKRGDLGLYLTLLLDHIQNGIDTSDWLGKQVVLLPEVTEVAENEVGYEVVVAEN